MKPRARLVLEMCIDNGAARGVRRAFKHVDAPSHDAIAEAVAGCISEEISEWFEDESQEENDRCRPDFVVWGKKDEPEIGLLPWTRRGNVADIRVGADFPDGVVLTDPEGKVVYDSGAKADTPT